MVSASPLPRLGKNKSRRFVSQFCNLDKTLSINPLTCKHFAISYLFENRFAYNDIIKHLFKQF